MCHRGKCLHPLEIGSLILGYVQAIISILGLILGVIQIVVLKEAAIEYTHKLKDTILTNNDEDRLLMAALVVSAVLIVVACVMLLGSALVSSLLVHGVHSRNENFVLTYVIYGTITNIMHLFGIILIQVFTERFVFALYIPVAINNLLLVMVFQTYKRIKNERNMANSHEIFVNEP